MDEDLWALLTSSSAVTDICGQRIYWGEAPEGSLIPYVVLHLIGRTGHPHQQGVGELVTYRVQIDSYDEDRPAARVLGDAITGLINGYRQGGLRLCLLDTERVEANEGQLARVSQDYIINWRAEHG